MGDEGEIPREGAAPLEAPHPEAAAVVAARQVTGYDGTFEEAVIEGLIRAPGVATWNGWQRWRREEGGRPTIEDDGARPQPRDEVALWRRAMAHYHGPDWATIAPARSLGDIRMEYPAIEDARGPEDRAAASTPPASAAASELDALAAGEPARERLSPDDGGSERSSHLPTPRGMLARLEQDHRPGTETLEEYQFRYKRVLDACSYAGVDVDYGKAERFLVRAEYLDQVKDLPLDEANSELRRLAVAQLTASVLPSAEDRARQELETEVLVEMLKEKGITASARPERLFSGTTTPQRRLFGSPLASEPAVEEQLPEVPLMFAGIRGQEDRAAASQPAPGAGSEPAWVQRLVEKLVERPERSTRKNATIRINPQVKWPMLADDDHDVEEFFEQFDELCGLANDGDGMSDKERLKVLLSCLRGTREQTYRVLHKLNRANGRNEADPGGVFLDIKARLMRFVETQVEKQSRILASWDDLHKGKMAALQFEPQWEKVLAELEAVGLARTSQEVFLAYLRKTGEPLASEIRKDQRPWPDGVGATITRRAATWQEAHAIAVELESIKISGKALQKVSMPMYPYGDAYDGHKGNKGKGKGKGKTGKQGGPPDGKGKGGKGICFEMRDKNTCQYGDACRYSHDRAGLRADRREHQAHAQQMKGKRQRQRQKRGPQRKRRKRSEYASRFETGHSPRGRQEVQRQALQLHTRW